MSDLIVIGESCDGCGVRLLESDNFCSNCGLPTAIPAVHTRLIGRNQPRHIPAHAPQVVMFPQTRASLVDHALNNRALVVAIILCAGPIGLPALWFSRRFSVRAKIITTTAYFLLTAILPLVALWYFLEVSLRPLVEAFHG